MATIQKRLSGKTDSEGRAQVLYRVNLSKKDYVRYKSGIYVPAKRWDTAKQQIKVGKAVGIEAQELTQLRVSLNNLDSRILKLCEIDGTKITTDYLDKFLPLVKEVEPQRITRELIEQLLNQKKHRRGRKKSFFELFDLFMAKSKISEGRMKHYRVVERDLRRFEAFRQLTENKRFKLDIDTITRDTIEDFESYLRNEHTLYDEYPHVFAQLVPVSTDPRRNPRPRKRGNNTVVVIFKQVRAFFNWCYNEGVTENRPFVGYKPMRENYGTPIYITLEERNTIAEADLPALYAALDAEVRKTIKSNLNTLEVQRDIFVFHTCIGCRVSDLMRLTAANIVDGEVHYIAQKTKENGGDTIMVPLNDRARALVEKYRGVDPKGRLFPYISSQHYNDCIKEIFTICGLTRMVVKLDPVSGEEVTVPLNTVASSHMARRTFVGNLYKRVKDPNLICPMSGHKENSRAFTRYREVDREMRKEVVNLLD